MPAGRILILTNRVPYPLNDGGNLAMKAMIDGYHANGWDVFLLCMNTSRHYVQQDVLDNIYTNVTSFKTVDVDNSVKPLSLLKNFLFSTEPEHATRFRNHAFAGSIKQAISDFAPDVVQVESVYLSTYLPLIRQCTNAKAVLRLHNIEYQVWERLAKEVGNPLKKFYLSNLAKRIKSYEERVWNQYDLLLPITSFDGQAVKKVADTPMHITPFGIDVKNSDESTPQAQWVGYHIGAMDWLPNREGIDWLLNDVWPLILKQSPDFRFYFAGRNMQEQYIQLNIKNVTCAGEVPDANEFMADKKILVVPIQSGGGIRVKILEAMAAGKVIISTSVGMQGIEAVPGTHFLQADTAEEFSRAVKWCLDHKNEAEKMGEQAKELIIRQYNATDIAEKLCARLAAMSI